MTEKRLTPYEILRLPQAERAPLMEDAVQHFATADFAHSGNARAIRLPGQEDIELSQQRWLHFISPHGQTDVHAYDLWANGYTPVWVGSQK